MFRVAASILTAAALAAGCASPRTRAEHRAALDACLAAPDAGYAPACERERILREQMEYERSENAALAMGAFALGILGLGIWAAVDDDDCCSYRRPHHHYH